MLFHKVLTAHAWPNIIHLNIIREMPNHVMMQTQIWVLKRRLSKQFAEANMQLWKGKWHLSHLLWILLFWVIAQIYRSLNYICRKRTGGKKRSKNMFRWQEKDSNKNKEYAWVISNSSGPNDWPGQVYRYRNIAVPENSSSLWLNKNIFSGFQPPNILEADLFYKQHVVCHLCLTDNKIVQGRKSSFLLQAFKFCI